MEALQTKSLLDTIKLHPNKEPQCKIQWKKQTFKKSWYPNIYTHIDHPFKYYNKCPILNLILDCNFSFECYVWCLGFFIYYFVSLWGAVILRCFIGTPSGTLFETYFWDRLGHFWITLGSWVISILCFPDWQMIRI